MTFTTASMIEGYNDPPQDLVAESYKEDGIILAVADGAGGAAGGLIAAQAVVERVDALEQAGSLSTPEIVSLLVELDEEIRCDARAGETTAVIAVCREHWVVGASVGDSGALLIRGGSVEDLTEHQHRKPLLGSGAAFPMPFEAELGDACLLLASDGLLKYTPHDRIAELVRQGGPTVTHDLVDLVRLESGNLQDDVSAILCRREAL